MRIINPLLLLLICHTAFSQRSLLEKKIMRSYEADELLQQKKFDSIITLFDKNKGADSITLYLNYAVAAQAYFEVKNYYKGFKYLEHAIKNQEFSSWDNVKYNVKRFNLDTFTQFKEIVLNYSRLYNYHTPKLNMEAISVFDEIFTTDQSIRNIINATTDSNLLKGLNYAMMITGSMNARSLKSLIQKIERYPGVSDIGAVRSSQSLFILMHLYHYFDFNSLIEKLREATYKGQLNNEFVPFLVDKVRYANRMRGQVKRITYTV